MGMYASNAGKSGGEYYTPQEVSELLTRITAFDFGASTPAGEKRSSLIKIGFASPFHLIEYGGCIATCIMVLKKNKTENNTLFIDASKECVKVTNNNKLTNIIFINFQFPQQSYLFPPEALLLSPQSP